MAVPKIIVIALCSIFLQTGNSLFPHPLESSFHKTSDFQHKAGPWYGSMVNNMNPIPTFSSTGNCPKLP